MFGSGEERKREGRSRVSGTNSTWVSIMREVAIGFSKSNGSVWIDDLRRWADANGCTPEKYCDKCAEGGCERVHQNAWGALFKGNDWLWTGEHRKSLYATNHHRDVRVWVYVGTPSVAAAPALSPAPARPEPEQTRWRRRKWGQ